MKTKLITTEGFEKLKNELDHLWRVERPEITKIVTWAAGLGDRSENADYQYNKRKLREIDRRVRYLRKTIEDIQVVEYNPVQEGKVYFGAWVVLEGSDENHLKFRIVGPEEIYGEDHYISIDSPMARACLAKQVDDEVVVQTPSGITIWLVNNIEYMSATM
ncbi:MAG: transcription elongation factor GreB [Methylophaga sp.]|nr:MAG: transcription elongation factor GreB [Methylophaga sp.]